MVSLTPLTGSLARLRLVAGASLGARTDGVEAP